MKDAKGFTLLELMIVLAIMGLMAGIALPNAEAMYQRTLLQTTAHEIESALLMARQLSMDESKQYEVLLSCCFFSIRNTLSKGKRIYRGEYPQGISKAATSHTSIYFNRKGVTGYGKFILENQYGQQIIIEIHIGTGNVVVSDII